MTAAASLASACVVRRSRPIAGVLRYAIGVVLLAVGIRTWLVLGWIEPVYVSGSSMAPAYCPASRVAACPVCLGVVRVGVETVPEGRVLDCPWCSRGDLVVGTARLRGDRVWIDRTAYWRSTPQRWMPTALICPDTGRLCLKRVLGLPGEVVEVSEGDLWIDGRRYQKSLTEQRAVRVPVHRETPATERWAPEMGSRWQRRGDSWEAAGPPSGWLVEQRPAPITDAVWFDLGRSRQLFLQRDIMLASRVAAGPNVELQVKASGRGGGMLVSLTSERAVLWELDADGERVESIVAEALKADVRGVEPWLCEVSTFDGQVLVAVDGQTLLRAALPGAMAEETEAVLFAVRVLGGPAMLRETTLWRDLYYGPPPPGNDWAGGAPRWQLGADEYFVAGDNGAVSLDSRVWGPAPARLLVGVPRRVSRRAIAFPPAGGRPL